MSDLDRSNANRFESEPTWGLQAEPGTTISEVGAETEDEFALRCVAAGGALRQTNLAVVVEITADGREIETPTTIDEGRGYN